MDINIIQMILILVIAFLAGLDGTLDSFQFHQPIVAATLIGLVTGHLQEGIILGGTLQLITLGWMNIGAALSPDPAWASIISAILMVKSGVSPTTAIAIAIPIAIAGLFVKTWIRVISVGLSQAAMRRADKADIRGVENMARIGLLLQGLQTAIPALIVLLVPADVVQAALDSLPDWLTSGLQVAAGIVVVVGYAMVVSMMATPALWPFFFIGFALSALTGLNLIAMGVIGLALALIYLQLSPRFNGGGDGDSSGPGGSGDGDQLDAILDDY